MPIARKSTEGSNYKFMRTMLYTVENGFVNGEHYQKNMESGTQFIRNLIDAPKTAQLPNLLFFFFKTLF